MCVRFVFVLTVMNVRVCVPVSIMFVRVDVNASAAKQLNQGIDSQPDQHQGYAEFQSLAGALSDLNMQQGD